MRLRTRIHHNNNLLIFLIGILAFVGCGSDTVYHHYEQVTADGWNRNDTLRFHVAPAKSDAVLHEEVELRINSAFPFMGLCLIVEHTTFPSNVRRIDTLNCALIDKNGKAKGKGINYIQNHFHLIDLSVNQDDSIEIAIHHNMKRENLPGIIDLGILLHSY